MNYGCLSKGKCTSSSIVVASHKTLKIKEAFLKGKWTNNDNINTLVIDKKPHNYDIDTAHPINNHALISKFKTTKNSPERSNDRTNFLSEKLNYYEPVDKRNISCHKNKMKMQVMIQSYIANENKNKGTIKPLPEKENLLKDFSEEEKVNSTELENTMKRKIFKHKAKMQSSVLNMNMNINMNMNNTNPTWNKYSQLSHRLKSNSITLEDKDSTKLGNSHRKMKRHISAFAGEEEKKIMGSPRMEGMITKYTKLLNNNNNERIKNNSGTEFHLRKQGPLLVTNSGKFFTPCIAMLMNAKIGKKGSLLKNTKNLFLAKINKNTIKASIKNNISVNPSLISHGNNMNMNMNSIILPTDQSNVVKKPSFKSISTGFHNKGISEIPISPNGNISKQSVLATKNFPCPNNVKYSNYLNYNYNQNIIKYTKSTSINSSENLSKKRDEPENKDYLLHRPLGKNTGPVTASHSPTNMETKIQDRDYLLKSSKISLLRSSENSGEYSNGNNHHNQTDVKQARIQKKISIGGKKCNLLVKPQASLEINNLDTVMDNSSDSIKSTIRQSCYYRKEMENIARYIRQYSSLHGAYPKTDIKFYKIGRLLGKGAFGKVNLALHVGSGRLVAFKSFNKSKLISEHAKKKIANETSILKIMKHSSIVKIHEAIETAKYIVIVMEYVCGGDLLSFVRKRAKLNETTAKFIFKQIIEAVQYIHSLNIVHRDVKLDNILFDLRNNVKICDFGVSKQIKKGDVMHDQCGTPAYIAPEILKNQGYEGFAVDIWSAGVVLYAMLSGTVPFKANNISDLHKQILKGTYQEIKDISDDASNLLASLLESDPKKRITINQILNHPWITSIDVKPKSKMNLFTAAEKILLAKSNIDYRHAKKDDLLENFTLKNLDTQMETENRNINTRSMILAPFNSSLKPRDSYLNTDIIIENAAMKFCGKAKELNRNYELNNNGEIDNGIIISPQIEDSLNSNPGSPIAPSPFNNSINNRIISKPISPAGEYDDNCNYNSINKKHAIDEIAIQEVEEMGYSREYIVKCLMNNELNYATAGYYLLASQEWDD